MNSIPYKYTARYRTDAGILRTFPCGGMGISISMRAPTGSAVKENTHIPLSLMHTPCPSITAESVMTRNDRLNQ